MMVPWALRLCGWLLVIGYRVSLTSADCEEYTNEKYQFYNLTVLVPLNGTAAFLCNVTTQDANLFISTGIWWPWTTGGEMLKYYGINVQNVDNQAVIVNVNGSITSDNLSISCYCYNNITLAIVFKAQVHVYGPPSPPTNLSLSVAGTNLNLSWTAPLAPPGVTVWYHVIIAGYNSAPTIYLSNVTHYAMNLPNYPQCELSVLAVNGAGTSAPSNTLTFTTTTASPLVSQSVTPSPSLEDYRVPLLAFVIVAPVVGLCVIALIIISIVAVRSCRSRRTGRLKIPQPGLTAVPGITRSISPPSNDHPPPHHHA